MLICEVVMPKSDDAAHAAALRQTGFWGRQGAGCVFFARKTRRFLIAHRSQAVEQPGTWGTWGGAIDGDEQPEQAVQREIAEETGHAVAEATLVPLLVFHSGNFRYSNFLAIVADEFAPVLNWETEGYRWCRWNKWPEPLHFGLRALLDDPTSAHAMQALAIGRSPA